jgi:hypothetical protein
MHRGSNFVIQKIKGFFYPGANHELCPGEGSGELINLISSTTEYYL